MLASLNLESLFSEPLSRYLTVGHAASTLGRNCRRMTKVVLDGNKILWCGNGGSATAHNIWRQSRWDVMAATAPAGLRLRLRKMVP